LNKQTGRGVFPVGRTGTRPSSLARFRKSLRAPPLQNHLIDAHAFYIPSSELESLAKALALSCFLLACGSFLLLTLTSLLPYPLSLSPCFLSVTQERCDCDAGHGRFFASSLRMLDGRRLPRLA